MSIPLPFQSLCRPLPKGAIGIQRTKALHDDGNSALIPGIWTSLLGDDVVVLWFAGQRFNISFRTMTSHFCWLMGWIPHKTEVLEGPTIGSKGYMPVESIILLFQNQKLSISPSPPWIVHAYTIL